METRKGVMSWKILKPTLSTVERTTDERTEVASLQCHQFPELGVHLMPSLVLRAPWPSLCAELCH